MADLGKIGITYDSAGYVGGKTYDPLTVIKYTDGGTYMSIFETKDHLPTDTNYWAVLVPPIDAGDIDYDNATSGLTADDVQSAIDELSSEKVNISDIANNLTTVNAGKVLDARQGKTIYDYLTNINTESVTERQIGNNTYMKDFTTAGFIATGTWVTITTLDVAVYKNVRVDFGHSYMIADNAFMIAIDSTHGTTGMIRYNYVTGVLQAYSATSTTLRPVIRVIYNK